MFNGFMTDVLTGLVILVFLITVSWKLVSSKLKSANKKEETTEQEDHSIPSVLGFLEFNNSDEVKKEYGTIVLNEILTAYSDRVISLEEAVKKLKKESFRHDDILNMLEDHIKNLDKETSDLAEEIAQKRKAASS